MQHFPPSGSSALAAVAMVTGFDKVSVPLHPSNPFLDFTTARITLSLNAAGINSESENQV